MSISFTTVIVIIIVKYPKNFIYLLIITRMALVTSLVLILVGGKYYGPSVISVKNTKAGP